MDGLGPLVYMEPRLRNLVVGVGVLCLFLVWAQWRTTGGHKRGCTPGFGCVVIVLLGLFALLLTGALDVAWGP